MFEIFLKYLTDKIELSDQEKQLIESVCNSFPRYAQRAI